MKFLLSIFVVIFLAIMQMVSGLFPVPPKSAAGNKFIRQYSERVKEKYNVSLVGLGGSDRDGKIKTIAIRFAFYGPPLNIEEARHLIVDCTNEFLSLINSDEQIRPYLKTYPYPPADVDLSIFCYNIDRSKNFDPYIGTVACFLGDLSYRTNDQLNPYVYKSITEETYEKGVAILQQQESNKDRIEFEQ